jgi:hypothetical protein
MAMWLFLTEGFPAGDLEATWKYVDMAAREHKQLLAARCSVLKGRASGAVLPCGTTSRVFLEICIVTCEVLPSRY